MKKRMLAITMVAILLLSSLSGFSLAGTYVENWLSSSHKDKYAADDFTGLSSFTLYNPLNLYVNFNDPTSDFSFWHFVDTSGLAHYANITFRKPDGSLVTWYDIPQIKNGQHYALITPSDWQLADGVSFSDATGNFVLSHSGRHDATSGKVMVKASAAPWYNEITPWEKYVRYYDVYEERTVDKYFVRTVDKYFVRTVDIDRERDVFQYFDQTKKDFYDQTVDKYWERDLYEYYQREGQKYEIPVFERKINSVPGTLVTRLTYSDNTRKAVPVNGGAFNNGHTYVKLNVAQASQEGGVWYQIADSSPNNGKKTPAQYNRPIGYWYNVRIVDGKLIISFPEDLAFANVGVEVVLDPSLFSGNAPKHYSGGVTVDLPAGYGDVVYMYTHIDGLGWYEFDGEGNFVYRFLQWRLDPAREEISEYKYVETIPGRYELVKTELGPLNFLRTELGLKELKKTEYGEYEPVGEPRYGDYVADTVNYPPEGIVYGDYAPDTANYPPDGIDYGPWTEVNRFFDEGYTLIDSGQNSVVKQGVFTSRLILKVDGTEMPLNTVLTLPVGSHVFEISSSGGEFSPVSKTVTILAGDNPTIVFSPIVYQQPDVTLETVVDRSDALRDTFQSDKTAVEHFNNLEATIHNRDLSPTYHDSDKAPTEYVNFIPLEDDITLLSPTHHYADRQPPIRVDLEEINWKPVIRLGDELNAWGEYAVRIN